MSGGRGVDLREAVTVVTGASSGIGAATAEAFARKGASVVCVARRADRLTETVTRCAVAGGRGHAVAVDVASDGAAELILAEARERYGPVDVLVNNAGIPLHRDAAATSAEEIEHVFAVNYFAAVRLTMAVLPSMLDRRRGSVINVTSVAGYLPNPQESAYGASKAALSQWSHGLAIDLHNRGVHVGVVSPGPIETEIWGLTDLKYGGKRFPAAVVADAIVGAVERGRVHVTAPRRFGMFPAMYPLTGRAFRWGLRRYARAVGD